MRRIVGTCKQETLRGECGSSIVFHSVGGGKHAPHGTYDVFLCLGCGKFYTDDEIPLDTNVDRV